MIVDSNVTGGSIREVALVHLLLRWHGLRTCNVGETSESLVDGRILQVSDRVLIFLVFKGHFQVGLGISIGVWLDVVIRRHNIFLELHVLQGVWLLI
jgi:hypothetical protein